jgi:hypothetical protein
MAGAIELRGFMGLTKLFRERKWPSPFMFSVADGTTGPELLSLLDIPPDQVEVIFINGTVHRPADAVFRPGDRVALVPPGTPGPYRALMGFKKLP